MFLTIFARITHFISWERCSHDLFQTDDRFHYWSEILPYEGLLSVAAF